MDLSSPQVYADGRLEGRPAAADLHFSTADKRWSYAIGLPLGSSRPAPEFVVRVDISALRGELGVGVIDEAGGKYVSGELYVGPQDQRTCVEVLVEEPVQAPVLIVRNTAPAGTSEGRLTGVDVVALGNADPVSVKRMRSRRFSYWHYDYDLGDGVSVTANLAGLMPLHLVNRDIMHGLIDEYFGSLGGMRVLDAGCSSGYHSFLLADRGAQVVAIDNDPEQIYQAQLVQRCRRPTYDGLRFECHDLLTYSSAESVDLVFCSGVFYHLVDLVGGARKIFELARIGAVVHSCVSELDGDLMVLADSARHSYNFPGEFAFVPTASMLEKIFRHVGFREVLRFTSEARIDRRRIDELVPHYCEMSAVNTAYYVLRK